jgi:hypothetical protein
VLPNFRQTLNPDAVKENAASIMAEKTLDELSACQLESDYVHKVSVLVSGRNDRIHAVSVFK